MEEQLTIGHWYKINTSVSVNTTISPSGVQNADSLFENTATGLHLILQAFVSTATTYSYTCYIKPDTRTRAYLRTDTNAGTLRTLFDLTGSGSVVTLAHTSATITNVGNGWYKCSITFIEGLGAVGRLVAVEGAIGTNISYTGNGLNAFYLWGAQLEVGAYPTSYIPTTSASVTRNADVITKTNASAYIGQTEGTIFIETQPLQSLISDGVTRSLFSLNQDSLSLNLFYLRRVDNAYLLNVNSSGTTVASQTVFTYSNINLNKLKIAIKYGLNTLKVFVNGVNTVNQTISSVPTTNTLTLGSNRFNGDILDGRIDSFQLYKEALTDEECITLTTL
jgi:hypothetical protein